MRRLLTICVMASVIACSSNGKETGSETPIIKLADPASYEGQQVSFPEKYLPASIIGWFRYYAELDTAFNPKNFLSSGVALHFGPLPEAAGGDYQEKKIYFPYLAYAPDSSHVIDGISYNHIIQPMPDGTLQLADGDADQQVTLIDLRNQSQWELMFNGPETLMESAGWLNEKSFLLAMTQVDESHEWFTPELLLFNLADSTYINFTCRKKFPLSLMDEKNGGYITHQLKTQTK